jgi:hypothetical protein
MDLSLLLSHLTEPILLIWPYTPTIARKNKKAAPLPERPEIHSGLWP